LHATLAGLWSHRISRAQRIVYRFEGDVLPMGTSVFARANQSPEPMNRES